VSDLAGRLRAICLGVRLDRDADWTEIAELCQDAYRVIAPARLTAKLDG
jgi:hypothetical protein